MKKVYLLLILPIIIFFLVLGGGLWWQSKNGAPGTSSELVNFTITKGSSAIAIGDSLEKQGFIKSAFAFKVYTQVMGKSQSIQAGQYLLPKNLSLPKLVLKLLEGPTLVWVTIPEGLRREEVVEKFVNGLAIPAEKQADFRAEFLELTKGHEGQLFPDTYLFERETPASKVVATMISLYEKMWGQVENNSGLSDYQTLILASLLERETITDTEKPVVAGIILKRLDAGWPLQIDASVQYAVGTKDEWWPILTREDLEIKSNYNTYASPGLPSTPIASPGLSSLKAAANPEESEYWYYIHDNEGKIHYAKTLDEHNANVRRYLGK